MKRLVRPMALVLALLPGVASGYYPLPPVPKDGPAALLYVRFADPGLHATFYDGSAKARVFPTPVTVGLRPGYVYRPELAGLPQYPGIALYPTLEVRGTLQISAKLRASEHPVPIRFSLDDIEHVLAGALVTKVYYLEDPETAVAEPTAPDRPLELPAPPHRDPLAEARDRGRPVLVVRLGQRQATPEELAYQGTYGTILLPGDRGLSTPSRPPQLPWACFPVYDPRLGPKPRTEECLHDGGDFGRPAALTRDNRLLGLDPGDTLAEYTSSHGQRHLTHSNRVCICVPRFVALRSEILPAGFDTTHGVHDRSQVRNQVVAIAQQGSLQQHEYRQAEAMRNAKRPSSAVVELGPDVLSKVVPLEGLEIDIGPGELLGTKGLRRLTGEQWARLKQQMELALILSQQVGPRGTEKVQPGPAVVGKVEGLGVFSSAVETRDLTVCEGQPCPPEKPLLLFKWADRTSAQVGDVVTFYLKFSNHGGKPITDVAVSDSLTGRLEYIPNSAKSNRDAVFTMQENDAGSLVLRWAMSGTLQPGESGVVSFQARVR